MYSLLYKAKIFFATLVHVMSFSKSSHQEDELADASNLLTWYRNLLTPIGIWPEDDNKVRFTLSFVYIFIHISMEYADFIHQIGNFDGIVANLSESTVFTMLLVKLAVFYKNRILRRMIDVMKEDCSRGKFRTPEEQNKYAAYYSMAKTFYKIVVPLVIITGIFYYTRPIAGYIFTTNHNGTKPFVLPYRTRIFYEITDVYTYALTYTYQVGAFYIVCLGSLGTDGLFIALTMHVCGQLSVLAADIAKLTKDTKEAHYLKIRSIVTRHLRLIWMEKQINRVFSNLYLGQVFGCASLICLSGFNVVVNSDMTQTTTLLTFVLYEASMLTALYGYCFVGECLIEESRRVHDAFYQCSWYEMPPSHSKDLVICIARSQKPFELTAGKFCVFSMEFFAREDELVDASNILTWYKNLLTPIGIWPEDNNKVRFTLSCVYIFIHISMEYADFINQIGSLDGIVANLSESPIYTMLLVKLVVFYKNPILRRLIDVMKEDFSQGKLRTPEEQNKYAAYYSIAKTFYKIIVPLAGITGSFYYLKPIAGYIFTTSHNGTKPFVLPYRTRIFYEITDVYTYALAYTYQVGAFCILCLGSLGTDGLLIALTMHVCGQLSALAVSIANLTKDTEKAHHFKIRSIVTRHLRLIWMEKQINGVFSNLYLGQVFGCAAILCLSGFNMVKNSDLTQTTALLNALLFEAMMLTFLYGYCFVGQCLIEESRRVHDAFYQCSWYEMPPSHSKDFVICLARSEKPFELTAGKFCIFSMEFFARVVRTAVGYISVLKTMT